MAGNGIGAEGARALEPALREMKQLQHLDLGSECGALGVGEGHAGMCVGSAE